MITSDQLIEILIKSGADIDKEGVSPNETFEAMGLDSLDLFNFFTEIDDELKVEVPDEAFENLDTIEKVRKYLESKLSD